MPAGRDPPRQRRDVAVVGAGAAGLFAAIWAARTAAARGEKPRIVALDGAKKLGAKVLIAGGGRCNVTHHQVSERDFCGSTPGAIRKVLLRFGVDRTVAFFREMGVELKREETGKLFPTTDDAHTVLDALLAAARGAGVEIVHPWRVRSVVRVDGGFEIIPDDPAFEPIIARRVVIAAGGRSLPKTGSDGHGYGIVRSLGHTLTPRITPALVPLVLDESDPVGRVIRSLSGVAAGAILEVRAGTGKRLARVAGHDGRGSPVLCTHFGISGPAALDISRHWIAAHHADPAAALVINWLPGIDAAALDCDLAALGRSAPAGFLRDLLPDRLAAGLCRVAGVDPGAPGHTLTREMRRVLVRALTDLPLPVERDRGYLFAEVTAGGVPLGQLRLETMESRPCPGLHLCGEICDVDGRIGGFNFQWAWASGFVAGAGAAAGLAEEKAR